jgi:predicted transcriptional regulator
MKRVSVTLSDEQIEKLTKYAKEKNVTATAIVQHALDTEFYIREEIAQGHKIIVKGDKVLKQLVFI